MMPNKKELSSVTDTSAEDKLLLDRVANKDTQALNSLYSNYAGLLMTVIYGVLKDKSESEDILQESFVTIWKKANMYQSHLGKPKSWMVTIAKNKAFDRYRKLVRKSEGMVILKDAMQADTTAKTVESNTDSEILLESFNELNSDQKDAIELVFYQGLTQQEAAIKLEAPLGTVKARIRRGLLKLKEILTNNSSN